LRRADARRRKDGNGRELGDGQRSSIGEPLEEGLEWSRKRTGGGKRVSGCSPRAAKRGGKQIHEIGNGGGEGRNVEDPWAIGGGPWGGVTEGGRFEGKEGCGRGTSPKGRCGLRRGSRG